MSGSKRRSYLGIGVANFGSSPLGIIDTNFHNVKSKGVRNSNLTSINSTNIKNSYPVPSDIGSFSNRDKDVPCDSHILKDRGYGVTPNCLVSSACGMPVVSVVDVQSQANVARNLDLALFNGVPLVDGESRNESEGWRGVARRAANFHRDFSASRNGNGVVGALKSGNAWRGQRASKRYLSKRSIEDMGKLYPKLDKRKEWNKWRKVETLLDLFTAVKYSHSSMTPETCRKGSTEIVCNDDGKKARVANIMRSHSIRLDPVEAPGELYKYRLRIDRVIDWAYKNNIVPVMMTLTIFHRWHQLEPLCRVLQKSWTDLFSGGSKGLNRAETIGLQGYIRRMEETINDGECGATNAGWHPHYHVLLLIPRDKIEILSSYEEDLKIAWVELMCKYFAEEFGEEIPRSYLPALMEHGLVISRYNNGKYQGKIREVHDSDYFAKIMGYDPTEVYGGDKEVTASFQKHSKIPFDLLFEETAANIDLWCEYAIATKGMPSIMFSYGLQKKVDEYFKTHTSNQTSLYNHGLEAPKEKVIAHIDNETYKFLYKNYLLEQTQKIAAEKGYNGLEEWFKIIREEFGYLPGLGIWRPSSGNNKDDDDCETIDIPPSDKLIEVKQQPDLEVPTKEIPLPVAGSNPLFANKFKCNKISPNKEMAKGVETPQGESLPIVKEEVSSQGISVPITRKTNSSPEKPKFKKNMTRDEMSLAMLQYLNNKARAEEEAKAKQESSLTLDLSNKKEDSSQCSEESLVNELDLEVARKLDNQIYITYGVKIYPLVSKGTPLEEAINNLEIGQFQKETVLILAQHYMAQLNSDSRSPQKV